MESENECFCAACGVTYPWVRPISGAMSRYCPRCRILASNERQRIARTHDVGERDRLYFNRYVYRARRLALLPFQKLPADPFFE